MPSGQTEAGVTGDMADGDRTGAVQDTTSVRGASNTDRRSLCLHPTTVVDATFLHRERDAVARQPLIGSFGAAGQPESIVVHGGLLQLKASLHG